ncbi:uncharacterized protein LOC126982034 [Eriocheir sinensis]|uniref:uncharacterized protein LOC126982034 n=1 Tax=Eriocheir sinensis TaxID=95602 RepID=UPI0021C65891|nr:uncharacterized protein LOC126982034 [Eriocheir sinensis]
MPRNTKKLDLFRKKQEEDDELLREAGMYEEGLSQAVKDQILQFVRESRETARLERLTQQLEEQTIAEALKITNTQQGRSEAGSSGTSSTLSTEAQDKSDDLVLLTPEQADEPECQVIKTGTGQAPGTPGKAQHSGRPRLASVVELTATDNPSQTPQSSTTATNDNTHKPSPADVMGMNQNNTDDDDIDVVQPTPESSPKPPKRPLSPCVILVPLPFDCVSPRKKPRQSPEVLATSPRMPRRKVGASASSWAATSASPSPSRTGGGSTTPDSPTEEIGATTSPPKAPLAMFVSPIVGRGRLPTTTSTTTTTTTTTISTTTSSSTTTTTAASTATPTKYNSSIATPTTIPHRSKSVITSTSTALTQLCVDDDDDDDDVIPSTPGASGRPSTRIPAGSGGPAPRPVASPAAGHNSSTFYGRTPTSSPKKAEKGASLATPPRDLHLKNSLMRTPSSAVRAPPPDTKAGASSPQEVISLPDLDVKPCLGGGYRPINIFTQGGGQRDTPLHRPRTLRSEAPHTALHPLPNETLDQARARITALLGSASRLLLQHRAGQLPRAWSAPLTVHARLRDSLDRPPSPPVRVVAHRRPLRERRTGESAGQAAPGSPDAPEALDTPEGLGAEEAASAGPRRRGAGGRLAAGGLRRSGLTRTPAGDQGGIGRKRPALAPLQEVSSDSDKELETVSARPALALPQVPSPPLVPSPPRPMGGTVSGGHQPQASAGRRTFRLLDSDSEGEVCYTKSSSVAAAAPHRAGGGGGGGGSLLLQKGTSSPQPGSSSDLGLKDQQQQQSSGPGTAAHAGVRQCRRRVRTPDLVEATEATHRKARTLHTGSSDQQASHSQSLQEAESTEASKPVNEGTAAQGQSREEEADEEKMSCPICQKLFPLQHIEVHASDCMGGEEESQQEQDQHQQQQGDHQHQQLQHQDSLSTHGPQTRRRRRVASGESAQNGPTSDPQEDSPAQDSQEVDSHPRPASPAPDTQEKIVNIFTQGGGQRDAPLHRPRTLRSKAPHTALHPLPNETLDQARARITALLGSASQLLLQHRAGQLPRAWSAPLTVHARLRDSLDRPPSPPVRVVAHRRPLRERRRGESAGQAAPGSPDAPEALDTPEGLGAEEAASAGPRRRGAGGRLAAGGLRRSGLTRTPVGDQGGIGRKRPALAPLQEVSSDSDKELETVSARPALALPQVPSPPLVPSPPRPMGGTVSGGHQPQASAGRRTFRLLDSDSEGEPGSSSDLGLKDQQQQQSSGPGTAAHAGVRQCRRRDRTPDLVEAAEATHRKARTLHTGSKAKRGQGSRNLGQVVDGIKPEFSRSDSPLRIEEVQSSSPEY